jgi:hypothetical protein
LTVPLFGRVETMAAKKKTTKMAKSAGKAKAKKPAGKKR